MAIPTETQEKNPGEYENNGAGLPQQCLRSRKWPEKRRMMLSTLKNPVTALTLVAFTYGLSTPSATSLFREMWREAPSLPAAFSSEYYSLLIGFIASIIFLSFFAVDKSCRHKLRKRGLDTLENDCIWMVDACPRKAFYIQMLTGIFAAPYLFYALYTTHRLPFLIVFIIALGPVLFLRTVRPFKKEEMMCAYIPIEQVVRDNMGGLIIWACCTAFILYGSSLEPLSPSVFPPFLVVCAFCYLISSAVCVASCRPTHM